MTITVPAQYQQYVQAASAGTGLPYQVEAAQAQAESNFNSNAVSSTGAEGFWQFEPGTYNSVAGTAGVPPDSEFNVGFETQAYIVYMDELLQEEGGNVFKALEAYNAGPGNLSAGEGYATGILNAAGQSNTLNVTPTQLTGFPNPLNLLNPAADIGNAIDSGLGKAISGVGDNILKSIGVPTLKDLLQRLGLIILGAVLVIVGLNMLTNIIPNTIKTAKTAAKASVIA